MGALSVAIAPASLALEPEWRALETRAPRSFFTSWRWAEALIAAGEGRFLAATVRDRHETQAIALLWPTTEVRHGALRVRQLRLNEIADSADDDFVFSERTRLFAAAGVEAACWRALIDALAAQSAVVWDELIVNYAFAESAPLYDALGLRVHRRVDKGSGVVDLAALRAAGVADLDVYVARLGKTTRSALARAVRLYRERGPLRIDRARDTDEAQAWFAEIVRLQTEKWRGRGGRGLGDRRLSRIFHERLIAGAAEEGAVELLRASAGETAFAWSFNFVEDKRIYFNVAGLAFEDDNRLKPGLVAHALAVEHHLRRGADAYDFLAGDDRYKTELGAPGPRYIGVALQRPRALLRVEDGLRWIKRRVEERAP